MAHWKSTDSVASQMATANSAGAGALLSILPGMPNMMKVSPSEHVDLCDPCSYAHSTASARSNALGSVTSSQVQEADEAEARRNAFAYEQAATKAFSDQDELRTRVRSSMNLGGSGVGTAAVLVYKQQGIWGQIARSAWFEWFTLAVIALNALWIAVDADHNDALTLREAEWPFQLADHTFCTLFVAEWLIRFLALKQKRDVLTKSWFLFDTFLVIMMVTETWLLLAFTAIFDMQSQRTLRSTFVLRVIRLFRIMRLTRMVRLMRACPELIFLVRGMMAATRSVVITMVLLFCILYAFGVAFKQLAIGTDMGELYFGSVLQSMYTLLMTGTLLDNVGITVATIASESPTCAVLFFVVIVLAALTVMNMLIGVTCEVVSDVASGEREKAEIQFAKEQVYNMLWNSPETGEIDKDHDFRISKEDFRRLVYNDKACQTLKNVGVDVAAMVDLAELIFQKDSKQDFPKLEFGEFMDIVLQLRGSNKTTVKDLVDMRRYLHLDNVSRGNDLVKVQERQLAMELKLDSLERKLDKLLGAGGRRASDSHHHAPSIGGLSRRNSAESILTPQHSPRALTPRLRADPLRRGFSQQALSSDSGGPTTPPEVLRPPPRIEEVPAHRIPTGSSIVALADVAQPGTPQESPTVHKSSIVALADVAQPGTPPESPTVHEASLSSERRDHFTPTLAEVRPRWLSETSTEERPAEVQPPTAAEERPAEVRPPTVAEDSSRTSTDDGKSARVEESSKDGSKSSTVASKSTAGGGRRQGSGWSTESTDHS